MPDWRVVAATGHRPKGLLGSGDWVMGELRRVATRLRDEFGTEVAISGMALGTDTMWAVAALDAGLELWAYVPFPQQSDRWPSPDRERWRTILERASRVETVSDRFSVMALFERNRAMARQADALVAVLDPLATKGGTVSMVRESRVPTIVIDPRNRTTKLRHLEDR